MSNFPITAEDISLISIRMQEDIDSRVREEVSIQYAELCFPLFRDLGFYGVTITSPLIYEIGEDVYNLKVDLEKLL